MLFDRVGGRVCMRVMDGKDAAAHSISYYGRLESNAVRALVSSNMLPHLCKTVCIKCTFVSQA